MGQHSPWKTYGRRGRRRTGPVGRDGLRRLHQSGRMVDLDSFGDSNTRQAHCKVCGEALQPGEGRPFVTFALQGYNLSKYYACREDYEWIKAGMDVEARGREGPGLEGRT